MLTQLEKNIEPLMKSILFSIIQLFILIELLKGQQQWTNYTTFNTGSNGLCSNNIEAIMEDHNGNLWIGTVRGLTKFNGQEWINIPNSYLPDDHINDIHEDHNGNIWISTYEGIGKFTGFEWTIYTTSDFLPNKNVFGITEDMQGNLWFATYGGIVKYDGTNWITFLESNGLVAKYEFHSILADSKGNIWVSNEARGLMVYNGSVWEDYYLSAIRMYEDSKGILWLGTSDGYYKDGIFSRIPGVTDNWVSSISEDKQGNIWFGLYSGGAARYDGSDWTIITTADGLPSNRVQTLAADDKGNIWIGTDKGLVKYDGKNCFVYTTYDGLADNVIFGIAEDNRGNMWFATHASGCSVFNGMNWFTYTMEKDIPSQHDYINTVVRDFNGNMWLGTYDGACKYDGGKWTFHNVTPDNTEDRVNSIAVDLKGNIWFGKSWTGISCLTGGKMKHYSVDNGLLTNDIEDITIDLKGNIWVAHFDNRIFSSSFIDWNAIKSGISKFDGTEWNSYILADTNNLFPITSSLLADRNGKIWVGTMKGIKVLDENRWLEITSKDGIIGDWILSLFEDSRGFIWAGTSKGLSCFDGSSWKNYSVDDGLVNDFVRSICEDNRGNMWFGTNEGVSKLDFDSTGYIANEIFPDLAIYYPNPVSDFLRIRITNHKQKPLILEIFNIYGQLLFKRKYYTEENVLWDEIDMSNLSSGLYLFRVTQDHIKDIEKIAVSHTW
jgi:ligand-binding sensor domain-containing protein